MVPQKSFFVHIIIVLLLFSCTEKKKNPVESKDEGDHYIFETEEDPDAPYVRDEWTDWIRSNHNRIESLDSDNFEDLQFLDDVVSDKPIVLLGEVAHGIAEQNRLRVRLIKYLHQQHDFSVVAFESELYDCYFTDKTLHDMNNSEVLRNAIYGFWYTADLWDLIEYIRTSYLGICPVHIAGFDFHSSGTMSLTRPQFFRDITVKIDSVFSEIIYETDNIIIQRRTNLSFVDTYVVQNYETVYGVYQDLIDLITDNMAFLSFYFDEHTLFVAREVAISVRQYILSRNNPPSYIIRDKRMADNVRFIREVLFPGQKMIIWSHNGHIQKDLRGVVMLPGEYNYTGNNMGYWLSQDYAAEMYSIGSLAYRGHINYGQVQDIKITEDESIEAILYQARRKHYFIDLSQQTKTAGNSWMFEPVTQSYIHRTDPMDIRYIPRNQYDGILFIDTVSEAQQLN
jgi:erythromycin esterase